MTWTWSCRMGWACGTHSLDPWRLCTSMLKVCLGQRWDSVVWNVSVSFLICRLCCFFLNNMVMADSRRTLSNPRNLGLRHRAPWTDMWVHVGTVKPRGLHHRESLMESKRKKRKCCAGGLAVHLVAWWKRGCSISGMLKWIAEARRRTKMRGSAE